ncbi:MAG: hypothetical protein WCO71_07915, partial [Pseudomonadota bacterium]
MIGDSVERKWFILAYMILLYGIVYSYLDTIFFPFAFDDLIGIIRNPAIKSATMASDVWNYSPERLIGFLTFGWNYQYGGLDPVGYHVVNILTHISVTTMVLLFSREVLNALFFDKQDPRFSSLNIDCLSLFTASIFALHPIQTQSVTYVYQRLAELAAFFYVSGLFFYVKYMRMRVAGKGGGYWFGGGVMVCGILGMFTKENFLTYPFACLLIDLYLDKSLPLNSKKRLSRILPVMLLLIILPINIITHHKSIGTRVGDYSGGLVTPAAYFYTQCEVILKYLGIVFFVGPQNIDHTIAWRDSMFSGQSFIGFSVLAALLTGAFAARRRYQVESLGVFLMFLGLAVESSVIPIKDAMFEHRMYLPAMGLFLAIGSFIFRALPLAKAGDSWARVCGPRIFVITLVSAGLSFATVSRNQVWATTESLWSDALSKSPTSIRSLTNLSTSFMRQHDPIRGRELALRILAIDSLDKTGEFIVTQSYIEDGDFESAAARIR